MLDIPKIGKNNSNISVISTVKEIEYAYFTHLLLSKINLLIQYNKKTPKILQNNPSLKIKLYLLYI